MAKRTIYVVSAAIVEQGRYLITQRNETASLPCLWEFPGGRVEDGESDQDALVRELQYRLGIEAEVLGRLTGTTREYEAYIVHLSLYRCARGPLPARALRVRDVRWVTSSEFDMFAFAPADQGAMDALLFDKHTTH